MATMLCPTRWVFVLMSVPENEVDVTTHIGVMAHFTYIHYVPV